MQKIALLISYIGGNYCGWQKQSATRSTAPSIQKTIEDTLTQLTTEKVSLVGSGRTDAGVHAIGQVAHFTMSKSAWKRAWREDLLVKGLNSQLPQDIRIHGALRVNDSFHAQRSAVKKQYSYYFSQSKQAYPHLEPFSLWVRKRLDIGLMNQALAPLVGTHDFSVFKARGSAVGIKPVKTIFESDVTEIQTSLPMVLSLEQASLIRFRVVGSGFLKQMIRSMAGTLAEIGIKKRPPEDLFEMVKNKARDEVGSTALSRGLWLEQVWYEDLQF
ncbi:MAG: tRNA pseudouridine(38-40) synthase TruA [Xanthomonadaceae bacterium]|nr:tRNA pseudouridine(38-40) synthase TruA [Xanthomonadaceae bacterium]